MAESAIGWKLADHRNRRIISSDAGGSPVRECAFEADADIELESLIDSVRPSSVMP